MEGLFVGYAQLSAVGLALGPRGALRSRRPEKTLGTKNHPPTAEGAATSSNLPMAWRPSVANPR